VRGALHKYDLLLLLLLLVLLEFSKLLRLEGLHSGVTLVFHV
jgi:hypothetical protein